MKKNPLIDKEVLKFAFYVFLPAFFCFSLSIMRAILTKNKIFIFLGWNLMLAIIPLCISYFLSLSSFEKKLPTIILLSIWLLFFPNAPYILTDMIHIKITSKSSQWLDLILLFSYALTGLLYSFLSLYFIEQSLQKYFNIKKPLLISIAILYLSAFGIYLGRFLRWNSWDVFSNTSQLIEDVVTRVTSPITHIDVWQFTFLLGTFLSVFYFSLTKIKKYK